MVSNVGKKKFTTGAVVKYAPTGLCTHIQIVEEFVKYHLEDATEHYKQCVVFSLLLDEVAPYRVKKTKDEFGKTIKGSGGPNITRYGKAVQIMCKMLDVVHQTKFQCSDNGMSLVNVPFIREMTEAQKQALKKGRERCRNTHLVVIKQLKQEVETQKKRIEFLERLYGQYPKSLRPAYWAKRKKDEIPCGQHT